MADRLRGIANADRFVQVFFNIGQDTARQSFPFHRYDFFGDDVIDEYGKEPEYVVGLFAMKVRQSVEGLAQFRFQSLPACGGNCFGIGFVRGAELADHGVAGQLVFDIQRGNRFFNTGMAAIADGFSGAGAFPAHFFIHVIAEALAVESVLNQCAEGRGRTVESAFQYLAVDGVEDDGNPEAGGEVVENPLDVVVKDNFQGLFHLHKNRLFCRIV